MAKQKYKMASRARNQMDSGSFESETSMVLADSSLADEQDVWNLYNLILRRDPETRQAIKDKVRRPLGEIFQEVLGSSEFCEAILPAIVTKTASNSIYGGTQSLGNLLVWAASRLPVGAELRKRFDDARSWADFEERLLTAPEILERFPALREASIDEILEQRRRERELEARQDIRGNIDYANVWEIRGWCANAARLGDKLDVDIFADNHPLGRCTCREYRRDIHEKLGGDGHYGFTFIVPASAQEIFRTEKRLIVRERSSGEAIGKPIFIRSDLPDRSDALDIFRAEIAQAKDTIALLEDRLARLGAYAGYPIGAYDAYVRANFAAAAEDFTQCRLKAAEMSEGPMISVVLTSRQDRCEKLRVTAASIQEQIYGNWELVVVTDAPSTIDDMVAQLSLSIDLSPRAKIRLAADATDEAAMIKEGLTHCDGAAVLFLQAGDRLEPDALYQCALGLKNPGVKAIYADEDSFSVDEYGVVFHHTPLLKPDLDLDYLLSSGYAGKCILFDLTALKTVAGSPKGGFAETILDFLLRMIESAGADSIVHLPSVLYHQDRGAGDSARPLIELQALCRIAGDYFRRNRIDANVVPQSAPFAGSGGAVPRLVWHRNKAADVTVIIPTRDHPELIGPCVASLLATTGKYPGAVRLLIMDNGTTDPIAAALLRSFRGNDQIEVIASPGPFNWSALNNHAAARASGDVLLFLNNDIVAVSEGWLDELAEQAMRPDIGAVGARLLFADLTVQHAGIVLGINGACVHEAIGVPAADAGYLGRNHLQRRTSAVTGACLATRRDVFAELNGFDDVVFKVTCNDIDYCLKAGAKGYGVVYTPFATLHHLESASRGFNSARPLGNEEDEALAALRARWPVIRNDPYFNPYFSRSTRPFAYLAPAKTR
jgi:GT2 family glycosyltransferase